MYLFFFQTFTHVARDELVDGCKSKSFRKSSKLERSTGGFEKGRGLSLHFRGPWRGAGFVLRAPLQRDSAGKMATEGSAELPDQPARRLCWPGAGADTEPGPSPVEDEANKLSVCSEGQSANPWSCGQPFCPPRRVAGTEERLPRRSEPERSSGRDCDSRKGECVYRWRCNARPPLPLPRVLYTVTQPPVGAGSDAGGVQ